MRKSSKDRKYEEAFKWYARMGQPDRADKNADAMPKSCDITVTDVDELLGRWEGGK
jgi:hypothetical protein